MMLEWCNPSSRCTLGLEVIPGGLAVCYSATCALDPSVLSDSCFANARVSIGVRSRQFSLDR